MKARKPAATAYTLVVGLGLTGLSVLRYLHRLGEPVIVVDSRDIPPRLNEFRENFSDIPLYTGAFDEQLFLRARRIVVSPGLSLNLPAIRRAREQGIEISGDIDLFAHEVSAPVVGITGSNGKSTVTTLLTAMANEAGVNAVAGGNIGLPVLDLLAEAKDLYVLELSSFQLESLHRLPMKAAVVLNISADHMDRYADLNSYAASKQAIYHTADIAVVNRDDALAGRLSVQQSTVIGFTLGEPLAGDFGVRSQNGEDWLCRGDDYLMAVDDLGIRGAHNVANALAALALGAGLGLPMAAMLNALKNFPGLPHRTQWVAQHNGINWYNDSKGTNVGATLAAIEGLPGTHVLIAGGQGKGADFSALRTVAKRLRAAVLIGEDADRIEQALHGAVPVIRAKDMTEAVRLAAENAQPGDNVLLSPACASFDMFNGFEHRGEVFMQAVREYLA
jgi:UDP-N-acetylmuramoylalanine--D-glutamate ligase